MKQRAPIVEVSSVITLFYRFVPLFLLLLTSGHYLLNVDNNYINNDAHIIILYMLIGVSIVITIFCLSVHCVAFSASELLISNAFYSKVYTSFSEYSVQQIFPPLYYVSINRRKYYFLCAADKSPNLTILTPLDTLSDIVNDAEPMAVSKLKVFLAQQIRSK